MQRSLLDCSYTSGGSGANTWKLWEEGWRGLLLDGNNNNPDINLHAHYLFASNIADLFKQYEVPQQPDLVSCDMDSHDFFVLQAVLAGGYQPRVILTEFNTNYPANMTVALGDPEILGIPVADYNFNFVGCPWGVSAGAWKLLADKYGYTIVGRMNTLDLMWVRNDLVDPSWQIPPLDWLLTNHSSAEKQLFALHHPQLQDPAVVDRLVDVKVSSLKVTRGLPLYYLGRLVAPSAWTLTSQAATLQPRLSTDACLKVTQRYIPLTCVSQKPSWN